MSASSAAKGKARAIDPDVNTSNGHPATQLVKPQPIPTTTLLNVEYPGILSDGLNSAGPSSSTYKSLERALSTLHPSALPPLTSSPYEGLNFLSKIPNEGLKVVECRLGGFAAPPTSSEQASSSSSTNGAIDQVYRAPLIGEAVPTHNIVIRIVKRTWRQKKRKRSSSTSPPPEQSEATYGDDMALDPALFAEADSTQTQPEAEQTNRHALERESKRSRYTRRTKKEYIVEILGMATNTVRFRSMADFAFQPAVTSTSNSSSSSGASQLDPVMALHRALATMDLKAFQNFRVPQQVEDYQLPTPEGGIRSNMHMVPPAFLSRIDVPFYYAFAQTPYSELRTVPTPTNLTRPSTSASFAHTLKRSNVPPGSMQRFVNRVRLSNIAPQPFRVGRDSKVPTKPLPDVLRIEHRCDPKVLTRLRELLVERPVWSRVALKNQLNEAELKELHGTNEKVYYALVGYNMIGGPWRDTVVRFGYDVRLDGSSRIFQRIFLRSGPHQREYFSSSRSSTTTAADKPEEAAAAANGDDDGDDDEQPEEHSTVAVARSSVFPSFGSTTKNETLGLKNTHMFDGTSLHRNIGNFQLCDIEDPLIKPYIWRPNDEDLPSHSTVGLQPIGTQWLLKETYDSETGWYTKRALDLIRALVTARFKALMENGKPLEDKAVFGIVGRLRQKWREEDVGVAVGEAEGENMQVELQAEEEEAHAEPTVAATAAATAADDDMDNSAIDPSLM